jgi:hypothetical protein
MQNVNSLWWCTTACFIPARFPFRKSHSHSRYIALGRNEDLKTTMCHVIIPCLEKYVPLTASIRVPSMCCQTDRERKFSYLKYHESSVLGIRRDKRLTDLGKCWANVTVSTSTESVWAAKNSATSRNACKMCQFTRRSCMQGSDETHLHHLAGWSCKAFPQLPYGFGDECL